jgi:hypothetical protein
VVVRIAWLPLLFVLAGCGDDRQPLWLDLYMLSHSADHLQIEVGSHGRAIEEASVTQQMRVIEGGFSHAATDDVDEMVRRLGEMARCTRPDGTTPDLADLAAVVTRFRADLQTHAVGMVAAGAIGAGRSEEERYQMISGTRFDELRAVAAPLGDRAAAYSCPLHD